MILAADRSKLFVVWVGVVAWWFSTNLREGVIAADVCDPVLNPLFRDVLAHYGVVAMPAESTMEHAGLSMNSFFMLE